jgi:hypothetical protein
MRAAFSTWNTRIAPVFDTARPSTIVDAESGQVVGEAEAILPDDLPMQKVMSGRGPAIGDGRHQEASG